VEGNNKDWAGAAASAPFPGFDKLARVGSARRLKHDHLKPEVTLSKMKAPRHQSLHIEVQRTSLKIFKKHTGSLRFSTRRCPTCTGLRGSASGWLPPELFGSNRSLAWEQPEH
jgi:hypothetical protein